MRFPIRLTPFFLWCVCGLLLILNSFPLRADAGYDAWSAAEPTRQKVGQLRKTDAKAAAALLEDELNKVRDPNVAADFYTLLADVYTTDLKDPGKALALFERALPIFQKPEYKVPPYHWMTMIANKASALVASKRLEDADKLLRDNHATLLEAANDDNPYGRYAARLTLRAQTALLEAQDKNAETTTALAQFLMEVPRFLTMTGKEGDWDDGGWPLRELLKRLQKQKRSAEALSWGKLAYRLAAFDKKEIENATRLLNGLWAEQENFPAIAQFTKAQTDAAIPNPLSKVTAPEIPPAARESLKKKIADLEGRQVIDFGPQKAREIVSLRLLLSTSEDLREAMNVAYQLLKTRPDLQDGSLQICRVFKAADGNLIRANNFLSYLEGNGENPVPAFLKETAQPGTPAAKP